MPNFEAYNLIKAATTTKKAPKVELTAAEIDWLKAQVDCIEPMGGIQKPVDSHLMVSFVDICRQKLTPF